MASTAHRATAPASLDLHAFRLDGKVAVITGTGGVQGRAAATLFADAGASVVGCDLDDAASRTTAEDVRRADGRMTSVPGCDLTDASSAHRLVQAALDDFGGIDIVYHNAATTRFGPIEDMSLADWRFTIANEVDLVFLLTSAAWPHLVARGGGSIITVGSVAGHRGSPMFPAAAHAAAKGAVLAMTRQLACEGAAHGIRVNSISPGPVRTPALEPALTDPDFAAALTDRALIKRLAHPNDVAHAALFLASPAASYITGADLAVDGGLTSWA